jgi:hypothetical protein
MGGREGEVERGPRWSWPYYGSNELVIFPLSVEKKGRGGDGERLGAPNEF